MSTFMAGGWFFMDENYLYGIYNGSGDGKARLARYSYIPDKNGYPKVEGGKVIDDALATCICSDGYSLFYSRTSTQDGACTLSAINIDGTGYKVIYPNACDYVQLKNGVLYFTDEDGYFCSINTDGTDYNVIIDSEVCFPYFVSDDAVVYCDENDGETLHLYRFSTSEDTALTETAGYYPVLCGSKLIYARPDDSYNYCFLACVNLETGDTDESTYRCGFNFSSDGKFLFTPNGDTALADKWKTLKDSNPNAVTVVNRFISPNYRIYFKYNSGGLISGKYFVNTRTGSEIGF